MADLLLGGRIDPATGDRTADTLDDPHRRPHDARRHRRHDRLGQDRPRRRAHRGVPAGRRTRDPHRPQGRPDQPLPHLPGAARHGLPPVGQRERRPEGRPRPRRVRRAAGGGVARRARRVGHRARAARRAARARSTSPSTRRGRQPVARSTSSATSARRSAPPTPRSSATRSTATSRACSACWASPATRSPRASTSCSPTSSRTRGRRGRASTSATLLAQVQQPPMRKLGVLELDSVLPARRPHGVRHEAQRAARLAVVRGAGSPATRSTSTRCCVRRTAVRGARSSRPRTSSDEQRQSVTALVLSKLVTWMRRQSGTSDLRALLYMDEVAGYLPPDREPADEEADHAAAQAGARVRSRRGALDAEPGRRRLQGAVQRRAHGSSAGCRPSRTRRASSTASRARAGGVDIKAVERHDQQPRQAAVPAQAAAKDDPGGDDHALGDELSARTAHARPDRPGDGGRRGAAALRCCAGSRRASTCPAPARRSATAGRRCRGPTAFAVAPRLPRRVARAAAVAAAGRGRAGRAGERPAPTSRR